MLKKYTFATPALRWHPKVGIALFSSLILLYFFTLKDWNDTLYSKGFRHILQKVSDQAKLKRYPVLKGI